MSDVLLLAKDYYDLQRKHQAKGYGLLPVEQANLSMVLAVENRLICGTQVRTLPNHELAARLQYLDSALKTDWCLASSLYLWYGCIAMAKSTRGNFNSPTGSNEYTPELRWRSYAILLNDNVEALSQNNPWIFLGISLAQELSKLRNDEVINQWVPPDSPYWKPIKYWLGHEYFNRWVITSQEWVDTGKFDI